jgi:hypothetical protein
MSAPSAASGLLVGNPHAVPCAGLRDGEGERVGGWDCRQMLHPAGKLSASHGAVHLRQIKARNGIRGHLYRNRTKAECFNPES